MKTFIYKTEFKNSAYGQKVTLTVYRVKNNKPELIGQTFYNTGSMRGHEHEALNYLVEQKELPKTSADRGGYINYDKLGKDFQIYSI